MKKTGTGYNEKILRRQPQKRCAGEKKNKQKFEVRKTLIFASPQYLAAMSKALFSEVRLSTRLCAQ